MKEVRNWLESMRNKSVRFLYAFGSTVDEKYRLEEDAIKAIVDEMISLAQHTRHLQYFGVARQESDAGLEEKLKAGKESFCKGKDSETQVFDENLFNALEALLIENLGRKKIMPGFEVSMGSGATYSYAASANFFADDPGKKVNFLGTMPFTVMRYLIQKNAELGEKFVKDFIDYSTVRHEFRSRTIALEVAKGTTKLMIASARGRAPEELDLRDMKSKIGMAYSQNDSEAYVVQLGSLNKGSAEFHSRIKEAFEEARQKNGKRTVYYAGTSDFKGDSKRIIETLRVVYSSDILSLNENELDQVWKALAGNGNEFSRGYKLAHLDELVELYNKKNPGNGIAGCAGQLKICHSAHGAIAHRNDWQGEQELVQQLLQLSVDGSTQVYERGGYHKPEDIMAYSANCTQRQKADFENHFGSIEAAKALNVVCAIAPQIQKPKGSLTGLGAVFDGLASSTIGLYLTQ